MIPKVETCIEAVDAGVEGVVILNGKTPHAVLLELFTEHGAGTLISHECASAGTCRRPIRRASLAAFARTSTPGCSTSTTPSIRATRNLYAQVERRMHEPTSSSCSNLPRTRRTACRRTTTASYGTTLRGLMVEHGIDAGRFPRVRPRHRPLRRIAPGPALAAALERLPGRRLIFTNGSRAHAEKVAERLGMTRPLRRTSSTSSAPSSAQAATARPTTASSAPTGIDPGAAAIFEDLARNLAVPAGARHDDGAGRSPPHARSRAAEIGSVEGRRRAPMWIS